MSEARTRPPWGEAAVLAVLTSLSRLPFVGETLYHWDSINFALALDRFDVAAGQPHAPGYPLYVLLGRMVESIFGAPQPSLAAISVAASGLAVGALHLLGTRLFDRRVGLAAALLLASSPLFWFYGEIALPHALDAFVVITCVWLLYRAASGEPRLLPVAAVVLGIAGGLRPQTEAFLAPLAIYAAWHAGWRAALVALVVLVVVDLAWLVPLVQLSGGIGPYFAILGRVRGAYAAGTSVLGAAGIAGLQRNVLKLGMYTAYGWGAAVVPAAVALAGLGSTSDSRFAADRRTHVIVLWIVPSIAFYLLVHMGQQGLVFVFLPALCLLSALAVHARGLARVVLPLAVAANAGIFLLAPTFPVGGERVKLLTAETLRRHDTYYQGRFEAIRRHFDPRHAFIVSSESRFPEFYLREYRLRQYRIGSKWERNEGKSTVGAPTWVDDGSLGIVADEQGLRQAVLFDAVLSPFLADGSRRRSIALGDGTELAVAVLAAGERLRFEPKAIVVAPAPE